ncbi:hypothetical protein [Oleiagrimonas soli]|nr:hypothetical protein [Oleiagrimonas soli]MBB6185229.1 hypothetical protein [Oleiagrimonas soli]
MSDSGYWLMLFVMFYGLMAWMPILWPTWIAWRHRRRMPRRAWFVGTVASLSYGVLMLLFFAVVLPLELYATHVAPVRQDSGHAYASPLVAGAWFFGGYAWLIAPLLLLAVTFFVTHRLAARWPGICEALRS